MSDEELTAYRNEVSRLIAERDALAATVERVRALCDVATQEQWECEGLAILRAALDTPEQP